MFKKKQPEAPKKPFIQTREFWKSCGKDTTNHCLMIAAGAVVGAIVTNVVDDAFEKKRQNKKNKNND